MKDTDSKAQNVGEMETWRWALFGATLFFVGVVITIGTTIFFEQYGVEDHLLPIDPIILPDIIAHTRLGSIRGTYSISRLGKSFLAFRGIRYAKPPVGNLRFKPPVPVDPWEGIYNATTDGFSCPQEPNYIFPTNEDCLFLNVYTNNVPESGYNPKRPVLVWIHAGGWYGGTGDSRLHGPQYLMDHDLVLVTINYRLGALGFLSTGDEYLPGNYGMKDQVLALRWVQNHILSFGGDPNRVTLGGLSAGGASVWFHMASPMSQGLFQRAIAMSSSINAQYDTYTPMELAKQQAKVLNCPHETSKQIYECMMKLPAQNISSSLNLIGDWGIDPVLLYYPIVEPDLGEERFLHKNVDDLMLNGEFSHIPFLTGYTRDEFSWRAFTVVNNTEWRNDVEENFNHIAPLAFMYKNHTNSDHISQELRKFYFGNEPISEKNMKNLGNLYSDSIINFGVHRAAEIIALHSREPIYFYQFSYQGRYSFVNFPGTSIPYGVMHQDDSMYLFYEYILFPFFYSGSPEHPFMETYLRMWSNFVAYGDPTPDDYFEKSGIRWEPMTARKMLYMHIDKTFEMKENLNQDRIQLWGKLFPLSAQHHHHTNKPVAS